jgi:hypothetical protein
LCCGLINDYSVHMFWKILIVGMLTVPNTIFCRVVHYDPAVIECKGKLRLINFPGPPNYESIKGGDVKEGAFILELDKPFDVEPTHNPDEPPNTDWEKNVQRIQLVVIGRSDKVLEKRIGKRVSVRGKLFHSITGHHHTPVLMEIVKVIGE